MSRSQSASANEQTRWFPLSIFMKTEEQENCRIYRKVQWSDRGKYE